MSKGSWVDTSKLRHDLQKLAILENKTGKEILKDQARLLVRDLEKITPPGSGFEALSEGTRTQQKAGIAAVKHDINKKWKPANALLTGMEAKNPHAAKSLKDLIRRGNVQGVKTLLQSLGWPNWDQVIGNVSEADHDAVRSKATGRAIGKSEMIVLGTNSLKQLIRTKTSHVGKAKGGWIPAMEATGASIPEWIKGHGTQGSYTPQLDGEKKSITMANLVRYARNLAPKRIIQNALRIRQRAIEQRINYKLFGRKSA